VDRFKNILVSASPGHLEATTLRAAIRLAEANGARLTLVDVVPPVPRLYRVLRGQGGIVDVSSGLMRHRQESLRHLANNTRVGPDTEVTVLEGEPFIEVIRHVLTHSNDLVIVGGEEIERGVTPELSSAIMHLLRKCPVPVWVMRPSRPQTMRILALVDPDPGDPVRDSLNGLVLRLATSLARREDADLHVGHAWELAGESMLRSSPYAGLTDVEVDQVLAAAEDAHREQLRLLLDRYEVTQPGTAVHFVRGDAGKVLPTLAERLNISLIVMGTVSRTGIRGLIIGNTAETILRSVRCSVLAVKPEGFVTPVSLD
jgi:nucleotide-binding universal stress UspA family protein